MIAAGLVEVGHRRITPERFRQILEAGDRCVWPEIPIPPLKTQGRTVHLT